MGTFPNSGWGYHDATISSFRLTPGDTLPARLLVGGTSFSSGAQQASFAPSLYAHVRAGELFVSNKGPNRG
ncbi:MAG TPA: hypothetical protein VF916_04590, partial [Ktedonobacterales bacterium]